MAKVAVLIIAAAVLFWSGEGAGVPRTKKAPVDYSNVREAHLISAPYRGGFGFHTMVAMNLGPSNGGSDKFLTAEVAFDSKGHLNPMRTRGDVGRGSWSRQMTSLSTSIGDDFKVIHTVKAVVGVTQQDAKDYVDAYVTKYSPFDKTTDVGQTYIQEFAENMMKDLFGAVVSGENSPSPPYGSEFADLFPLMPRMKFPGSSDKDVAGLRVVQATKIKALQKMGVGYHSGVILKFQNNLGDKDVHAILDLGNEDDPVTGNLMNTAYLSVPNQPALKRLEQNHTFRTKYKKYGFRYGWVRSVKPHSVITPFKYKQTTLITPHRPTVQDITIYALRFFKEHPWYDSLTDNCQLLATILFNDLTGLKTKRVDGTISSLLAKIRDSV